MLASEEHLAHWLERNRMMGNVLDGKFDRRGVTHDLATWTQIARWSYAQAFHVGNLLGNEGKRSYGSHLFGSSSSLPDEPEDGVLGCLRRHLLQL